MARIEEVTVTLVDDLDGSTAAETIQFALDGKTYEIDLSRSNASKLRRAHGSSTQGVERSSGRR